MSPSRAKMLITPGRIVLNVYFLCLIVVLSSSVVIGMLEHVDLSRQTVSDGDVQRQVISIKQRLLSGADEAEINILPEGAFLSNVFYGYSLVNLSLTNRGDTAFKQETLRELERVLRRVPRYLSLPPFNRAGGSLPGGIIHSGNVNRLLAGYVMLGGSSPDLIKQFHERSGAIYQVFCSADPPFPESFDGLVWPVDTVGGLDSLRLHDALFHTKYFEVSKRWLDWLKTHPDPETGLMVAQAKAGSEDILDGTRGCAMTWTFALLPSIDGEYSRQQYQLFRKQWFVPFGPGLLGVREWSKGVEKRSDFKPGPVVQGMGSAATGLAIAGTRANSDWEGWHRILRSLEVLGFPQRTIYGQNAYFFGTLLLPDAIALWGKTIVPWSGVQPETKFDKIESSDFYLAAIAAVILISSLLVVLMVRRIKRFVTDSNLLRPRRSPFIIVIACIQTLLALVWIFTPILAWMQVLIMMGLVDLMEELTVRPRTVAQHFGAEAQSA